MAEEKKQEQKFPSETIDLPSECILYPKDSPLANGKLEIKYMTAKEEDILTSQNLIKKGLVLDRVLNSLILTEGVTIQDLVLGDKNAIMVAARILAYGPEYECEIIDPNTGDKLKHTFNLASCPFKKLPEDFKKDNKFEIELPISKTKVQYKILTGKEEEAINTELKRVQKLGTQVSPELTTRLRYSVVSVDGNEDTAVINHFSQNVLARDSIFLRTEMQKNSPDIDLSQEIDIGGETVKVNIPMTVNFFWPGTQK